jgi:preprotein translocase subunit SecF
MARSSFAGRLYRGEISYDFIRRRRWWYLGSGLVILVGIVSLVVRGINPSIDFKGGAVFQFPEHGHTISQVQSIFGSVGVANATVQTVGDHNFYVQTAPLSNAKVNAVDAALSHHLGIAINQISPSTVGASWGSQITDKALISLIVFLIAVVIYLSLRFEPKMALAAIVALVHDLLVTAGIYSLAGFQVSPSTVIALLTILGYSLYDTVVVFDKVRENTAGLAGGSRMTFSQAANLAVNQTLVRSINTSVIALLPVAGLLIIGAGLLGAGSLKDLALALLIGLASGAYSSIFIATPLLCDLKEREPQMQQLARRVAARQTRGPAVAMAGAGGGVLSAPATSVAGPVLEQPDQPAGGAPVPARPGTGAQPARVPPSRPQGPRRRSARRRRRR